MTAPAAVLPLGPALRVATIPAAGGKYWVTVQRLRDGVWWYRPAEVVEVASMADALVVARRMAGEARA